MQTGAGPCLVVHSIHSNYCSSSSTLSTMAASTSASAATGTPVDPLLSPSYGLSVFQAAAHHQIPDDAWEYQIRRSLNDAAYNSLVYVPYCGCTPTCVKCDTPKFMWKKK